MKKKDYFIYKIIYNYDDDLGVSTQKWQLLARENCRLRAVDFARDYQPETTQTSDYAMEVVCRHYDAEKKAGRCRVVWSSRKIRQYQSLFSAVRRFALRPLKDVA